MIKNFKNNSLVAVVRAVDCNAFRESLMVVGLIRCWMMYYESSSPNKSGRNIPTKSKITS